MTLPKLPYKSEVLLWNAFISKHQEYKTKALPSSFYFCDNEKDANECAELVVKGIKQATATSLWWYNTHKQPLPKSGDLYIITDWNGHAKAIIQTIKIEQVPYREITEKFAATEGEGDKSLRYWKKVHEAYYKREMIPYGASFSEEMIIVCEYFKTLYKYCD